jgi:RHH-type rel operon transcriptional repressor/antitoxin RelB
MLTLRLPTEMEKRLSTLAKETHRTKSYYVKRALEEFLDDQEDYLLGVASYEDYLKSGKKSISLEELEQKLGLHDSKH